MAASFAAPASALIGPSASPDGAAHPYVALIVSDGEFCTASALSPTVLVTAAHCLSGETDEFFVSFREHPVRTSDGWFDSTAPGVRHGTATDVSDWCGHDGTCGPGLPGFADNDLAVVVLDEPVRLSRYAALPTASLTNRLQKGDVTLVGYGDNAIHTGGGHPYFTFDGTRRAMGAHLLSMSPALSHDFIKYEAKGGSSGMCFGDSGGPVLMGDTIIGVNSFLNGMCSSFDVATRLDTPTSLAEIRAFM
jgi:hypothetical protein